MTKYISFIITFVFQSISLASYTDYISEIRSAEKDFISSQYEESLNKYMITLQKFDYPYLKETLQAAFVACYAGKKELFIELITHATNLGLTEDEYESITKRWEILNKDNSFTFEFQKFRSKYLNNLNWEKTTAYLKLDVYRTFVIKNYPLKKNNHTEYYLQMNLLRDRYMELIPLYGYVNDKDTGRRFKINQVKCDKKVDNTYSHLDLEKDPFMLNFFKGKCIEVETESRMGVWSSLDPGAWFLSHYVNGKNINHLDTTFFETILKGMDSLKASPYLVVNMLESTRLLENDFALTYYSRVWLGVRMRYWDKYNLDDLQKKSINANRVKYGFRTLEEEEELVRHLYFLNTNKQLPEKFKNSEIDLISFENRIFIQVMA